MIGLLTRRMPGFEGVAAGQTATLRLPIGYTYHQLIIDYGTMSLSDMTELRVYINGENVQTFRDMSVFDSIFNQYEGRPASADNIIVLDFERYGCRTRDSQIVTAIGTGAAEEEDPNAVRTLSVEIDIDAAATGVALSARALQSPPSPLGVVKVIRRFVRNPTGAGEYEISDLPTSGNLINKVLFRKVSGVGNIDRVQLERDNFMAFDRTAEENDIIQSAGVRVPQADLFVVDPTEDGFGAEGLATAGISDFRFTLTMSGAAAIEVYVEYVTTPGAFSQ